MKIRLSHAFTGIICAVFAVACDPQENNKFSAQDTRNVTDEAMIDAYYQDMDDLGNVTIKTATPEEYGRTSATITVEDDRVCQGAVVTIVTGANSTPENPNGVITIDFGAAGCTDLRGINRKGKLILTYNGPRWAPGSTVVTTTDNYYVNGIRLEGTRTTTNISGSTTDAPKFNIVLANGKATFDDGTFATRTADLTMSWIRAANPAQDKLIVHAESTAEGATRNGTTYAVSLLEQLEYQRFCPMAVSGIKSYLIDGTKTVSIDYGNGACDKTIDVTINGFTATVTAG